MSAADIVDNAAQADADYPMKNIGAIEAGNNGKGEFRDVAFGTVKFAQPGLKLIRFMSNVPKQRLQIDRIQFQKE